MIVLGPTAYSTFTIIAIALLLDRSKAFGAETSSKSTPWFPSGPPPTKPPPDTPEELQKILPLVTFNCKGKNGYFTDPKFSCEVFHYCKPDGTRNTFLCPPHSIFNQLSMVCEEVTSFNTRLCQVGTANPKKKLQKDLKLKTNKKHLLEESHKQHRMTPQLARNISKSKAAPVEFNLQLEELLKYMDGKRQVKTIFDPNGFSGDLVRIPTSTVNPLSKVEATKFLYKNGSSERPNERFSKVLINSKKVVVMEDLMQAGESKVVEDVIVVKENVQERKHRKHKRVGRVLDVDDISNVQFKGKKHSHVFPRSATENPPDRSPSDDDTTTFSTSPSLFTADRSKAKEFRKSRRRNLNRRRKMMRTNETKATTDTTVETWTTTSVQSILQPAKQDSDESVSLGDVRGKDSDDIYGRYSESWMGRTKSEIVKPYSLPPLPIPKALLETTTKQAVEETTTSSTTKTSYRIRAPWYKTTPVPIDGSMDLKFGEKISDLDHHHSVTNVKAEDVTGDHKTMHSDANSSLNEKHNSTKTFQNKSDRTQLNDERFFNRFAKSPESLFPPPRAEPRELKALESQKDGSIFDDEDSTYSVVEPTTTVEPVKGTYTYIGKHRTRAKDNFESRLKWRRNEDKRKKKIEVGSSFYDQTNSPREKTLQVPSTSESPFESTKPSSSAHTHLLNLMNEFFAMTHKNPKGKESHDFKNIEEEMATLGYGNQEDDMFRGESITEEVEELPPGLLDVVELIASQSEEDPQEIGADDDHEIIKINGPITHRHLHDILSSDDDFLSHRHRKGKKNGPAKKYAVSPSEDHLSIKDLATVSDFASMKLEPLLKQMGSNKKRVKVVPMKPEHQMRHGNPTVLKARQIPVRVIYRNPASQPNSQKAPPKPNMKIIRSQLPKPGFQVIQNGRIANSRPRSQVHPQRVLPNTPRPLVLHPKSIYPPHPPPLPKPVLPFKFGFPFANGNRPIINDMGFMHHRKRRYILKRNRRHLPHNSHLLPFQRSMFPTFNSKFVPTFTPFKNMFAPMHSADSNMSPFNVPRYAALPANSPPAPVRHITQNGDQTVIVEEVPVPIHVEVPDPNFLRPVHTGNHQSNAINLFPNTHVRNPTPPPIQTLPLLQGFQGRFPVSNSYQPFGLSSNVRSPNMNYHSSLQYSQPLPPRMTNQGQMYGLGVTTKPLGHSKPQPVRQAMSATGRQPSSFQVHPNTYPAYPVYQGAFTTPLTNEPVMGRLMFSGYKPPKSTPRQKTTSYPSKTESRTPTSRNRPVQQYFYTTKRPLQGYNANYKPNPKIMSQTNSNYNSPKDSTVSNSRPSYSNNSPSVSESPTYRKRRPIRRKRPRPTTTTSNTTPKEVSPTIPPKQIPPPPSTLPLHQELPNSIHNSKEVSQASETSHYPPAGYYGKDQLVQFFDSSANSYKKPSTSKPHENNIIGGNSSSERDDSTTSSNENFDQPVFGTRLKSNSQNERRKRKRQPIPAPTQKSEVQTRPSQEQKMNRNGSSGNIPNQHSRYRKRGEDNVNRHPRYRPRSRPIMPSRQPDAHPFEQAGNFYNVPSGLQEYVDPSYRPSHHSRGHTDMFGIPHPIIEEKIYVKHRDGHREKIGTFFKVPEEVEKHHRSPLHKMNVKPMPESAREFFAEAIKESSKYKTEEQKDGDKKDGEVEREPHLDTSHYKKVEERIVKKLRKPKRKHRYHPRNQTEKLSSDIPSEKAALPHKQPDATTNKENLPTTSTTFMTTPTTQKTTTLELRPVYTPTEKPRLQNDNKDQTLKPRAPLLPRTLPDLSKQLQNGKIDFKKLNATISTSVSVSGGFPQPQQNNANSGEESTNKRVFSSQNGGLAVVSGNAKRKKQKQKSDRFGSSIDEASDVDKSKYDIAASVLDIIKATTDSEKHGGNGNGFYSNRYDTENSAASQISNTWLKDPERISITQNRTETT